VKKILTIAVISLLTIYPCLGASREVSQEQEYVVKKSRPSSNNTHSIKLSTVIEVISYSRSKRDLSEINLNKGETHFYDAVSTHTPLELKIEKLFSINHRFSTSTALRFAAVVSGSEKDQNHNSSRNYKLETEYTEYGLEQRIHLNLDHESLFRPYLGFQVGMSSISTKRSDTSELGGIHTNIKTGGELCWKSGIYMDTSISYSTLAINEIGRKNGTLKDIYAQSFTGVNLGINVGYIF